MQISSSFGMCKVANWNDITIQNKKKIRMALGR